MTPSEEEKKYIELCFKGGVLPSDERRAFFDKVVAARAAQMQSPEYIAYEKERIRRQQRTVTQTIQEDGAIISPIDDKQYVTERSWEAHKKAENVEEAGNEIANKRKREKTLS